MAKHTHNDLCKIGLKWCQRSVRNGGHNCKIAVTEIGDSEIADAIGFLPSPCKRYPDVYSVLVEAKTSRGDFLRDAKKEHRQLGASALGDLRYYICPEGLISVDELPDKWGLIYVNSRGHVKVVAGAAASYKDNFSIKKHRQWLHDNVDRQYERKLIFDIVTRVNSRSIESRHDGWRETYRENNKLKRQLKEVHKKLRQERESPKTSIRNRFKK